MDARARRRQCWRTSRVEMPPPSDEVRDRESRVLLEDLGLFVEAEADSETGTRRPSASRWRSAAARQPSEGEPLDRARARDDRHRRRSDAFRIAGRIDRIDRMVEEAGFGPTFEIIDYKTGGYFAPSWKGTFAGGTRLQHALYGLAALELLKQRSQDAHGSPARAYYFSSAKGEQERKPIPAQPRASSRTRCSADLRDVIADGLFVHAAGRRRRASGATTATRAARASHRAPQAKQADPRARAVREAGRAMNKRLPPDAARPRLASSSELERNLLVEAGAGSGKTQELAARMAAGIAARRCTSSSAWPP